MRPLPEIRGLKLPDEFVARHFFKRGLEGRVGQVVELGCGAGNNLALYGDYGWTLTGVDLSAEALENARWNLGPKARLVQADLSAGLPRLSPYLIDVLLIPNLLCYLTDAQARAVLTAIRPRLAAGAEVFVRTRLTDDYRYGRGVLEEPDGWRLATPETGEEGLFNLFYTDDRLAGLMAETLGVADPVVLHIRFDNIQAGRRIPNNSDIVLWGAVP